MTQRDHRRFAWSAAAALGLALGLLPVISPAARAGENSYEATRVDVGGTSVAVAVNPATDTAYAAVQSAGTPGVAVIDGATNSVIGEVRTVGQPRAIGVDPTTDTIYVAESDPGSVAVINGMTDEVTATIGLTSGDVPEGVAVNPQADTVYVSIATSQDVVAIDGQTSKITAAIAAAPGFLAADAGANEIYDALGARVQVIDGSTNKVKTTITLPGTDQAAGASVDPAAGKVFVGNILGSVSVIATASNTVTGTIGGLGTVENVAADPGAGTLFTTTQTPGQRGSTEVVSESTGLATDDLPRGGTSLSVDPATGVAYITGDGNASSGMTGYVSIVEPSTSRLISPVLDGQPMPAFVVGKEGTATFGGDGYPSPTLTESGSLPTGVSFTADGISGTPASGTGGQYDFQVTLSNGVAPADVQTEVLTVGVPPVLGAAPAGATFRTGEAGRVTFSAVGYPQPAFAVAGALPAGVEISQSGVLSGTPGARTGGRYPLTVAASNFAGSAQTGFELVVDEPASFTSARHVTLRAGVRARFAIVTRGYPAAHLRESGRLPTGLVFRASAKGTATLSGKAARRDKGHTYKIVITASNGVGPAVRQVIEIRVR